MSAARKSRGRPGHKPLRPNARRKAIGQDPTLQPYLDALGGYHLLDAAQELALAREIERLEIELWRALLSHDGAAEVVAAAVAPHLPARSPALAALARIARGVRSENRAQTRGALITAAARKLRAADAGRTGVRAADRAVRERFAGNRAAGRYLARVATARAAHERAKHEFVTANLRLVVKMARRYRQQALPLPDLIQEGNIGLMRAVERFDHGRGFRFSTYAGWWIRQSLNRALSNKARLIRVPVHRLDAVLRAGRAARELGGEVGPSGQALPLAQAHAVTTQPVSLDRSRGRQREQTLHDVLAEPDAVDAEESCDRTRRVRELQRLLDALTPVEAEVLRLRFGLGGSDALTLRQTGAHYGLSRERIRQIQQEALVKLRGIARHGASSVTNGVAA
jgi:RNA polymerase primary sigma factor